MSSTLTPSARHALQNLFGDRLQANAPLAKHTTARVGGPADALLAVNSAAELQQALEILWAEGVPYVILGAGSNVLFSDAGFRGVVLLNRAKSYRFENNDGHPLLWAESGANLGALARQAALRGFAGLEWAATIPGTLGGAVYGNAGAHGGDTAGALFLAEILHPKLGKVRWGSEQMEYSYRSSRLKRQHEPAVILSASLRLQAGQKEEILARMEANSSHRRRSQPPGATMGSMFKNPPGDYAGRLIEAAGLKGSRIGGAVISPVHANFFINEEGCSAADIASLIQLARETVAERFGVQLELEIELLGEWPGHLNGMVGTSA